MATAAKGFNDMRDNWPNDEHAAKQWLEERLDRIKRDGIFAEVMLLTPALAKEFRLHNADNRPIRPAKLKQVVEDIVEGRYVLNGETIIFADTGEMNDGQHRCAAVIETMRAVETVIVFGVSRDSRRTVDNGASRAPGDHLAVEGFTYATDMASIGRFVITWERNSKRSLSNMNRVAPTSIVERGLDDTKIHDAAVFGRLNYTKAPVAPPSVIGFCYYVFSQVNKVEAEKYLKGIVHGANLPEQSAMYQVREHLLALDRQYREHRVEYLFAGFVAHLAGLPLGRYRIRHELVALDGKTEASPKQQEELFEPGKLEKPTGSAKTKAAGKVVPADPAKKREKADA